MLDSNGVVVSSWDPDQIGEQVVDPEQRSLITEDTERIADEEWLVLGTELPDPFSDRAAQWREPTSGLFGDLRDGQRERNLAMTASIGTALIALSLLHWRRDRQLRAQQARLDALLQQSSTIVSIVDPTGHYRFMSSGISRHTGLPHHAYVGRSIASLVGNEGFAEVLEAIDHARPGREAQVQGVVATDQHAAVRIWDIGVADLRGHPDVRHPVEVDGVSTQVDASAGIALGASDSQVGHLLRSADNAMYRSKDDGRSRWTLAEPAAS